MDEASFNWELLVRYVSRECTPAERRRVEERLASDPDVRDTVDNLRKILRSPFDSGKSWDVDGAWQQYVQQYGDPYEEEKAVQSSDSDITIDRSNFLDRKKQKANNAFIFRIGAVAAAAAAAILIAFLVYSPQPPTAAHAENKVIATKYGQYMHFRLNDGTTVVLNAASKLVVPEQFGDTSREVTLVGEAYFKVTHNAQKPFVVHVKNGTVKDLGTHFVVKAYPDDRQVRVVVAEGKVALTPAGSKAAPSDQPITENEMGILTKTGDISVSRVSNTKMYLGWTKGKLIFNNASFDEVRKRMERWYNIKIHFADSVTAKHHLTTTFAIHQPLKDVLEAVALSLGCDYTQKGQTVTFYKN